MERKRKEQCTVEGSPYGTFSIKYTPYNRELFNLRYQALLLNVEFQFFCTRKETPGEVDIISIWKDIDNFMKEASDFEKCLLFYGNIFNMTPDESYQHFIYQHVNGYIKKRGLPLGLKILDPGSKVPEGALSVSFDPTLNKGTLIEMFKNFLDKERPTFIGNPGNLPDYFTSRINKKPTVKMISKYLQVYKLKKEHPNTWYKKASKLISQPITPKSRERTLRRYAKAGENLSYWAARGIFPKVSNPTK